MAGPTPDRQVQAASDIDFGTSACVQCSAGEGWLAAMHHVALGARNVEELSRFYREAFDLSELRRHDREDGSLRSIWLDSSGVVLMIEQSDEEARQVEEVGRGPFLLAFSMSALERAEREARVLSAGGQLETRSEFSSYFRDPEGNRCALSCYEFD